MESIPVLDLTPQYERLKAQFAETFTRLMSESAFIMGPDVAEFEKEVASYVGVKHAIGLNSGTDALVIGLRARGIGPGDEVITSTFSFFATAEAISVIGAKPVLVDIDLDSFNLNPAAVGKAITARTKAIIPVHLFGRSAEMQPLLALAEAKNLFVLEDCAQAFGGSVPGLGKKIGSVGHAAALSFFPSKNLGALGDGGMLLTNDDRVADQARMLRAHGAKKKYHNEVVGYNSRLDTFQAAFLRLKLPHLDAWNNERRETARLYNELLNKASTLVLPKITEGHVFHQYTIRVLGGRRDELQNALAAKGIGTMIYYPVPIHRLPVYEGKLGSFPISEQAAAEVLSLPMGPGLGKEKVKKVAAAIEEALA
jgi:dTDP-4-amino-4,6-dideoxygalactose transaminase